METSHRHHRGAGGFVTAISLVLLLSLSGCSGSATPEPSSSASETPTASQSAEPSAEPSQSASQSSEPSQSSPEQKYDQVTVHADIQIDKDWTEESTPFIIQVSGSADSGAKVDEHLGFTFDQTVAGAKEGERVADFTLAPGKYNISVVSPVNPDASVYLSNEYDNPVTVAGTAPEQVLRIKCSRVEAKDVKDDQYKALIDQIQQATEHGEGCLAADEGQMQLKRAWQYYESTKVSDGGQPNPS